VNIVSKLLLVVGIIVGASLALAVGITTYVFSTLSAHGVNPGTSYDDDYEYQYSEAFSESFDATGKTSFVLTNPVGKIQIIGWNENHIEINGTRNGQSQSSIDKTVINTETSGQTISVTVDDRDGTNLHRWSVDFEVFVPQSMNVEVDHGVGTLRIEQFTAIERLEIDMGVGKIEIVEVTAESMAVEVGAGDLFVDSASATDSNINLGVGNVNYRISRDADVSINLQVGIGELDISGYSFPNVYIQEHSFMSRSAEIELGNGTERLMIEVGIGNLELKILESESGSL